VIEIEIENEVEKEVVVVSSIEEMPRELVLTVAEASSMASAPTLEQLASTLEHPHLLPQALAVA
jgi:hypothetical protein